MLYHDQSEDYRPLFWAQGRPVYANTLVVAFHILAFVVAALAISSFGYNAVVEAMALDPSGVWHGEVWRLFSYVAFDPTVFYQHSLWFFVNLLLIYFFGREVEQFVGRSVYFRLYAALVLLPAMLLCLLSLALPLGLYLNCGDLFFGFFVAFATIYPGVLPSGWIPLSARALMWILLGISTLIDWASHDLIGIFMLWTSTATAYGVMRLAGAGSGMTWLTDWLEERRHRRLARARDFHVVREQKATESIDAVLEKISRHGVESLNARERAVLERARVDLLKRDQR